MDLKFFYDYWCDEGLFWVLVIRLSDVQNSCEDDLIWFDLMLSWYDLI
jgi:hypothetical protein